MTKQDPAGRPASVADISASEAAIEVTPDMIDAGVEQFLRDYPETGTGDGLDRRMVGRIYGAMRAASFGIGD